MSDWRLEIGTFTYRESLPPNTSATVTPPAGGTVYLGGEVVQGRVHELGAGTYKFELKP